MNREQIARLRLVNLGVHAPRQTSPLEVVRYLGAMQAQDYAGALWSIGLRLKNARIQEVEQALADAHIVRTWPMRGTLHIVPAEDAKWMLKLLTPRVISSNASRDRNLELDDTVYAKAFAVIERILKEGVPVERDKIIAALEAAGITTTDQRGYHILWRASQEALICLGPIKNKQPTYVLFDAWIAHSRELSDDEAICELARRYFTSHGPATELDFAGWTKLPITLCRRAIAALSSEIIHEDVAGTRYYLPPHSPTPIDTAYLLPGFDEYMLGYKDRTAALLAEHAMHITPGNNGVFRATVVADGQVVGIWKRNVRSAAVNITLELFDGISLTPGQRAALAVHTQKYGTFLGTQATLTY